MSADDFEARGGWQRWRAMSAPDRARAEARTAEFVAELLDRPGRSAFVDFPVVLDGREVEQGVADAALRMAKRSDAGGSLFERWCAALPEAQRRAENRGGAWLLGTAPQPAFRELSPAISRERAVLAELDAPVVVSTQG